MNRAQDAAATLDTLRLFCTVALLFSRLGGTHAQWRSNWLEAVFFALKRALHGHRYRCYTYVD